ncbi:MAG: EAL domain-containing protein, partial [Porphyrobacter sp.]|nr:EAL domain-containing protein [Porphyrobacter sp.]
LLNRRRLNELLAELGECEAGQRALLLIDLDYFKRINDFQGHAVGDHTLQVAAQRLKETCPPEASCVRLGGDEFAVLLDGAAAEDSAAELLAARVLESLAPPIDLGESALTISASIGVSSLRCPIASPSLLLERADLAMYQAKRNGRNCAVLFDSKMDSDLQERKKLEAEMREGITAGQFVPYFQPIVDLASSEVTGFEVLARWQHPTKGIIEPPEFLELAERIGVISDLSFGVMLEALSIARAWPARLKISVNISPVQFKDPLIAQRILKVLSLTGFPPARLELEIMERSLLEDLDQALAVITSLKNSGISVSVDDFGTGYASLAQLKSLPFDRIKIDRRFIASLLDDQRCDTLVRAIAMLGKGLKMPITAEGVEAESLRSKLRRLGCSDAQGWFFARALSAKEVSLDFGGKWQAEGPEQARTANR